MNILVNQQNRKKKSSQYYGVTFNNQYSNWIAILHKNYIGKYKTEKEAAIGIDIALIKKGEKPCNILKKVRVNTDIPLERI